MKSNRSLPEINSSSMADMAFILLVFFIVATTIQSETGLLVKLPYFQENPVSKSLPDRNVFHIMINSENEVLVEGKAMTLFEMSEHFAEQAKNINHLPSYPDHIQKSDPHFGEYKSSNMVISVQHDRKTDYNTYINVRNELMKCISTLRNEEALKRFGLSFESLKKLGKEEEAKFIKAQWKLPISEAEPFIAEK